MSYQEVTTSMGDATQAVGGGSEDCARRAAVQNPLVEGSPKAHSARPEPEGAGRIFDSGSLAVGALYVALSVIFFGRRLIFDRGGSYVGHDADPSYFIWSISWWPYALSHRLNPILTHTIFVPGGTNLAWSTLIPLASVTMWPITAAFGPVVSYNLLALLAPATDAWAAYILCRYLTKSVWPAILGGYVFGFCSYLLAHILGGHLVLVLVMPIPIALYLTARWFDGTIESRTMVWLAGLAISAELLLSLEVFATATMFAGLALLLSFGSTAADTRKRIVKLLGVLGCAYGMALLIASPFLYYVYEPGHLASSIATAEQFSNDLLNLIVPTIVNALGTLGPLPSLTRTFPANWYERNAYVGPVLIIVAIVYARHRWKESFGKTAIDLLLIICVLSLGPILQIGGHGWIALPGFLLEETPLINIAGSARFMMFAFLIIAIITAQWFASSDASLRKRWIVAILVVLFSLPNLDSRFWVTKSDTPEFFTSGIYKKYLEPGENVLVAPYSLHGNSMLWQAQTGFYFRMAGGWTGILPEEYMRWPVIRALTTHRYLPEPQMQLMSFLANHQVGAIVSVGNDPADMFHPQWLPAGAATPIQVGGVTLYRLAPATLNPYRTTTAAEMERQADVAIFDSVLAAVSKYQAESRNPGLLTPLALDNLGLLPPEWTPGAPAPNDSGAPQHLYRGVWIGYIDRDLLGIGITGRYDGLKPIIDRYRTYASRIYFPFPRIFSESAQHSSGDLFIFFNPDGLKRAIKANADLADSELTKDTIVPQ
jgi:hypothetical protein